MYMCICVSPLVFIYILINNFSISIQHLRMKRINIACHKSDARFDSAWNIMSKTPKIQTDVSFPSLCSRSCFSLSLKCMSSDVLRIESNGRLGAQSKLLPLLGTSAYWVSSFKRRYKRRTKRISSQLGWDQECYAYTQDYLTDQLAWTLHHLCLLLKQTSSSSSQVIGYLLIDYKQKSENFLKKNKYSEEIVYHG